MKRVRRPINLLLLLNFLIAASSFGEIQKPLCPVIYAGSSGEFELYWFYPGLHQGELGNLKDYADNVGCVGADDELYVALTRFPLTPPVYICSVSTFISGRDIFPDLPGNQFTPITLTLKERNSVDEFSNLWQQTISLNAQAPGTGEVVTTGAGIGLSSIYDLWVGLEWLNHYPTAPMIGINIGPRTLQQYIAQIENSRYFLQESQEEFMVGLDMLSWVGDKRSSGWESNQSDSLSFEIFFAIDSADFPDSAVSVDQTAPDSLCSKVIIQQSGFVSVRATDGQSAAGTNPIYLDIWRKPPVIISPGIFDMAGGTEDLEFSSFHLQNNSSQPISGQIKYDSSILSFSRDAFHIDGNGEVAIGVGLTGLDPIDSVIITSVTLDFGTDYYPMIYHLIFRPSEPTGVTEEQNLLPASFTIGEPYPNPFNPTVCFRIKSRGRERMRFEVLNLLGQRIFSQYFDLHGEIAAQWDGRNQRGEEMASGIYFFRFTGINGTVVRRAVLVR